MNMELFLIVVPFHKKHRPQYETVIYLKQNKDYKAIKINMLWVHLAKCKPRTRCPIFVSLTDVLVYRDFLPPLLGKRGNCYLKWWLLGFVASNSGAGYSPEWALWCCWGGLYWWRAAWSWGLAGGRREPVLWGVLLRVSIWWPPLGVEGWGSFSPALGSSRRSIPSRVKFQSSGSSGAQINHDLDLKGRGTIDLVW